MAKRHPRPAETILVIEESDASLRYDRDVKLPLYAESGIEVWVVNLNSDVVEVHRDPQLRIYQRIDIFEKDNYIESKALPAIELRVSEILD